MKEIGCEAGHHGPPLQRVRSGVPLQEGKDREVPAWGGAHVNPHARLFLVRVGLSCKSSLSPISHLICSLEGMLAWPHPSLDA